MQEKRPPTSIKLVAALQILFGALGLVDNAVLLAMLGVGLQGERDGVLFQERMAVEDLSPRLPGFIQFMDRYQLRRGPARRHA